jgi:hypothetical protein
VTTTTLGRIISSTAANPRFAARLSTKKITPRLIVEKCMSVTILEDLSCASKYYSKTSPCWRWWLLKAKGKRSEVRGERSEARGERLEAG